MIKKKISMGMAALLALSMTACGGTDSSSGTSANSIGAESSAVSENTTAADLSAGDNTEAPNETINDGNDANSEDDTSENNQEDDYYETAQLIWNKTQELFTALKEGDVDTVIALADPNFSIIIKGLEKHKDDEDLSRLLQTLYADLVWMDKDEEDLTALAAELQRSYNSGKAGDTFLLDVVYADKSLLNFDDFLVLNFQQGDMISKYYRPETEEEAWQILEDTLELVPKTRQTYVALTLPDENGDFHFLYTKTSIIDSAHFDDLDFCSSNTFIQDYVKYLCDISPERIVQDEDSAYEDDDEIKRQFTEYIVNKDFEAAATYAEDTFDTDYSSYGTYDALSDAQKAFVDDYVQNMDVFWSDYSIKGVRHGSLTVYGDALDYSHDDIDTWYRENNVKDTSGGFYFSTSKLNYLAFSVEMYKCAIKYASQTITE